MFPIPSVLGPPIETEEQARNWVLEIVDEVELLRRQCDIVMTNNGPVAMARRDFMRWMIKRGEALGVLQACKRLGKIGDIAYTELRARVLATQVPTVIARPGVLPFGEER